MYKCVLNWTAVCALILAGFVETLYSEVAIAANSVGKKPTVAQFLHSNNNSRPKRKRSISLNSRSSRRPEYTEPLAEVRYLIQCETGGRNIEVIDSNGKQSRGILQFQDATWEMFSRISGIVGSPLNEIDAIRMANWAVKNGLGHHWSCWRGVANDPDDQPSSGGEEESVRTGARQNGAGLVSLVEPL